MAVLALIALLAQELMLYDRSRESIEQILVTAKTPVEIVLMPEGPSRPNFYGHYALGYGGQPHADFDLPNPAFFGHLDWVVKRASGRKLDVRLIAPKTAPEDFVRYLQKRYERNRRVSVVIAGG